MAFTGTDGRTNTSMSEINVTPMVDVMLVLLIIFMVTAPIIQTGIEVNLPKTRFVKNYNASQQFVVSLDKKSTLYFMSNPININELGATLKNRLGTDRSQPVYLQADGEVKFATVVRVMDVLREHGFTNIQILTRPILEKRGK